MYFYEEAILLKVSKVALLHSEMDTIRKYIAFIAFEALNFKSHDDI